MTRVTKGRRSASSSRAERSEGQISMSRTTVIEAIEATKVSSVPSQSGISSVETLTIDDFFTGLLAGLAEAGVSSISLRGAEFYKSVERAYHQLVIEAPKYNTRVRFRIMLDPAYEDSAIVRRAISTAVQGNLVSLDNPEYQDMTLKISTQLSTALFADLPGGPSLYKDLAKAFLASYPFVVMKDR